MNIALLRIRQASGKSTWVTKLCHSDCQFLTWPFLDNGRKTSLRGFTVNLHFLLHLLCTIVLTILRPSEIKHFQLPKVQSPFINKYLLKFHAKPWWECLGRVLWAKESWEVETVIIISTETKPSARPSAGFHLLSQPKGRRVYWKYS